jgi:hypothetical protein
VIFNACLPAAVTWRNRFHFSAVFRGSNFSPGGSAFCGNFLLIIVRLPSGQENLRKFFESMTVLSKV